MATRPPRVAAARDMCVDRRRLLALPWLGVGLGTRLGTGLSTFGSGVAGLGSALASGPALAAAPGAQPLERRALIFPRDHGAHPAQGIEWWYLTGWLSLADPADAAAMSQAPDPAAVALGFQLTFFRRLGPAPATHASRLAARQLLMAHAALTVLPGPARPWAGMRDLARLASSGGRHLSAQRIARVAPASGLAAEQDTDLLIGPAGTPTRSWQLRRQDVATAGAASTSFYEARFELPGETASAPAIGLSLQLRAPLPPLLQGEAGWSRKGPRPEHASFYVSEPQLHCQGQLHRAGRQLAVNGRAWLDHEWSSSLLPAEAVGWDWLGINLFDGSALTLFRLRRVAQGRPASAQEPAEALWAGGSWRDPQGRTRQFGPAEIHMQAIGHWASPGSRALYPVRWRISTPVGDHELRALLNYQEVDARASTATRYWEGLAELRSPGATGRRLGLGYLELTGYGGRPAL